MARVSDEELWGVLHGKGERTTLEYRLASDLHESRAELTELAHVSSGDVAEIARLREALKGLLEEYDDRKGQFGGDYLWKKHEQTDVIEAARAIVEGEE